jgi:hypothetical protein
MAAFGALLFRLDWLSIAPFLSIKKTTPASLRSLPHIDCSLNVLTKRNAFFGSPAAGYTSGPARRTMIGSLESHGSQREDEGE